MATTDRKKLLEAVTWAGKVAATMPRGVPQNVHLACTEGCLTVSAMGGTGRLEARIPCEGEPWETWVGVQAAVKVLKSVKGSEVEIEATDNGALVRAGKRRVRVGAPGKLGEEAPPPVEAFDAWQIQIWGEKLARLLGRVNVTVSKDETRQHLAAVALTPGPSGLGAVSTDGHRLHRAAECATCDVGDGDEVWTMLPLDSAVLLEHVSTRLIKSKWDSTGGVVLIGRQYVGAETGGSASMGRVLDDRGTLADVHNVRKGGVKWSDRPVLRRFVAREGRFGVRNRGK